MKVSLTWNLWKHCKLLFSIVYNRVIFPFCALTPTSVFQSSKYIQEKKIKSNVSVFAQCEKLYYLMCESPTQWWGLETDSLACNTLLSFHILNMKMWTIWPSNSIKNLRKVTNVANEKGFIYKWWNSTFLWVERECIYNMIYSQ